MQQTPSAQKPPVHWLLPAQVAPTAFLAAQVLLVRSQNDPEAQFTSAVQAEGKQVVPFMQATPPGQAAETGAPRVQFPVPSQLAGVVVSWLATHDDVPLHGVPAAASAQARLPLQKPVAAQTVAPNEQSLSALLPLGSAAQTPSVAPVFVPMQDSQVPVQSLSQQNVIGAGANAGRTLSCRRTSGSRRQLRPAVLGRGVAREADATPGIAATAAVLAPGSVGASIHTARAMASSPGGGDAAATSAGRTSDVASAVVCPFC